MKISSSQRLKDWRDFRKSVFELSEQEQLHKVIDWWGKTPFILQPVVDWEDISSWPSPWELINYGEYCRSGIS